MNDVEIILTDEDLFFVVKDDYEYLFNILYNRHQYLIKYWVKTHHKKHSSFLFEDAMQIAKMAFFTSITSYVCHRLTFINFARANIHFALLSEIRRLYQLQRHQLYSLDEEVDGVSTLDICQSNDMFQPVKYLHISETVTDIKTLSSNLDSQEQAVWALHRAGLKNQEIADELGISKRTVSKILAKIRQEFRDSIDKFL